VATALAAADSNYAAYFFYNSAKLALIVAGSSLNET